MNSYRTHLCSQISIKNLDEKVVLSGWVHSKRDHGNLLFIDLRDNYGITQCVVDSSHSDFDYISSISNESVLTIKGIVSKRSNETINNKLPTGKVEIKIDTIDILSKSETLPLPVNSDIEYGEEIRLKFRYIDLRRDKLHNNIILRNKFSTFDFKTNIHYIKNGNVIFLDNIIGEDLYNVIKFSQKVIATHGTIPSIASMFRKPCLDLFDCEINNIEDYRRMKNAFHEFKPSYPAYDFIIPRKNINKTINKMIFSLKKVTENA